MLTEDDRCAIPRTVPRWWDALTAGLPPEGGDVGDLAVREARSRAAAAAAGSDPAAADAALADLYAAAALLHRRGIGPAAQEGTVAGVHAAARGGVPKPPVSAAQVTGRGIVGDAQAAPRAHGRPWQALSLWSAEVITELVGEGHALFPGAAGENLTLAGLDWSALATGARLRCGSVELELTLPCTPCTTTMRWFRDGDATPMLHTVHPERTRWYARVLRPGVVAVGDDARILGAG